MGLREIARVAFACAMLAAGGCSSSLQTFQCETSEDCDSQGKAGGVCEAENVCSFADSSCGASGQRFGDAAGSLSHQCVGASDLADASGPDDDIDADPIYPDATPDPDADPLQTVIDAAPTTCVNLELNITDGDGTDDKVKIKVNGTQVVECTTTVQANGIATATCNYCMPIGANMELKAEAGTSLDNATTDCASICAGDTNCQFTASVPCTALYEFDLAL